ncbi:MAG: Oligopeptide transport ATP-binding protein OppD [Candidatus Anoxychlamydiales bacterium]|nr:Oligopeptide transport ATP-binding protein OppD [Candidatus Anoxychlamydiales bacterium]
MNKLLQIKNLSVNFLVDKKTIHAIRNISFDLYENEILAIVGESGSGKSVLMHTILKLLSNNTQVFGNIYYKNKDLLKLKEKDMKKIRGSEISIIFQDPFSSLNPTMKIGKQILEAVQENKSKQKVYDLLEDVEIKNPIAKYNNYPHQLSGGERQRVMIAIAIASNPKIIIADEPTTSLDVTIQKQILDLLKKIKDKYKTSIIFISHDLSVVKYISKKTVVMYAGKIVEIANINNLISSPYHPYTRMLIEAIPKITQEKDIFSIEGSTFSSHKKESGCLFYNRCLNKKRVCENSLLDIYKLKNDRFVSCHLYKKEMECKEK